jgi:hypothetical protein
LHYELWRQEVEAITVGLAFGLEAAKGQDDGRRVGRAKVELDDERRGFRIVSGFDVLDDGGVAALPRDDQRGVPTSLQVCAARSPIAAVVVAFDYGLAHVVRQHHAHLVTKEAEETVTVPAGTFKTLKVVCRNKKTGAIRYEAWYSLDLNQVMKLRENLETGQRIRELIAFKLR